VVPIDDRFLVYWCVAFYKVLFNKLLITLLYKNFRALLNLGKFYQYRRFHLPIKMDFGSIVRKLAIGNTRVASRDPIEEIRRDMILTMALNNSLKYGKKRILCRCLQT
jgi:hypothetical protein